MIKSDILSIDVEILEAIKMHGAHVQGVYQSTMHLTLNDKVITLGQKVGTGKHHIVVEDQIQFNMLDVKVGDSVSCDDEVIDIGGHMHLFVRDEKKRRFEPYMKTYHVNQASYRALKGLKTWVEAHHFENFYTHRKDDPWFKYQFEKIGVFLDAPGYPSALSILGLGMGLTPLGDDILTGFILGLNTVGKSLPWIEQLVKDAKKKTSLLSAQNLEDTYQRLYPDMFIEMIEGLMIENNIEKAKTILKLGSTSGAGILTGFMYGCM